MLPSLLAHFDPKSASKATVVSGKARFTILKSRLIRMEYDPEGKFEDRPSQVFWYRNQPLPTFQSEEKNGWLTIETEELLLRYKLGGEFFWRDLEIKIKKLNRIWHFGDVDYSNLQGTARTLDRALGRIPLGPGLNSPSGWSVVDDSQSLVFDETGWLIPRQNSPFKKDFYFFGYGHDYLDAICEYQQVSGLPGLLPRWALGNWWSRYWAYSQSELLDLMHDFQEHQIPLSVCIVDMDWHLTRTGNESSGWTGYTWNRDLFPQPEEFIKNLHSMNLKTALNLHPAEGIHAHESQYPAFAAAMGLPAGSTQAIPFDIASKQFTQAYFEILHHPMESQGVDFWWLDWQQETETKTPGLDPLYWLNHLHYYDLGRSPEKRPFIFSRWPGLGGHRYPIGFSGDSLVAWETLAFEPEFTATAANVAYAWWSHDIGGHCEGIEEPELYLRWVQFGIFSPIMRIHSTNNAFIDRRPWSFDLDTLENTRSAMQLRHQLVPLLYTAARLNNLTGEPPILPIYYSSPENADAYICPQEYTFCQQLLAAPITSPVNPDTNLARQVLWLPEGDWFDFFKGTYQPGGNWMAYYGIKADIPVFAKAGSIIPLSNDPPVNGVQNPHDFVVRCFTGKGNSYELYEDDGQSQGYLEGAFCTTKFIQTWESRQLTLTKEPTQGELGLIPSERSWQFEVVGIHHFEEISAFVGDAPMEIEPAYDLKTHSLRLPPIIADNQTTIKIQIKNIEMEKEPASLNDRLAFIISHLKLPSSVKQAFWQGLPSISANPAKFLESMHDFKPSQLLAIYETYTGPQKTVISTDLENAWRQALTALSKLL